ncbi:MAG: GNAT family N-acetyltransferase [Gaiellales bacterium]
MIEPAPARPAPSTVQIRAVEASDADALRLFYATLSPESRYQRFLGMAAGIRGEDARRFCGPDHVHAEGFVAVLAEASARDGEIIGHLCMEPADHDAIELAIAVADGYQRQGIGHRLVAAGRDWAERAGLRRIEATMLAGNGGTVALLRSLDRPIGFSSGAGVLAASVELVAP